MSSSVFSMPDMAPKRLVEPCDQFLRSLALDHLRQQPLKQGERLQRLAQVVAGGGEKARFRDIGQLAPAAWPPPAPRPRACRSVMSAKVMTTPSTPLSWVR